MFEVRDFTGADVWVCVTCERVDELKPRPTSSVNPIPPRLVLGRTANTVHWRRSGGPSAS